MALTYVSETVKGAFIFNFFLEFLVGTTIMVILEAIFSRLFPGSSVISLRFKSVSSSYWTQHRKEELVAKVGPGREVYTYKQLPEHDGKMIRLIELLPSARNEDVIRINLRQVLLSNDPDKQQPFQAISYCWGDPKNQLPIICDDGDSVIWITLSLYGALRRLRYTDQSRWLWADAICIDQSNALEKNHQVRKMADIYRTASRVLVWLGEESEDSGLLQELVPRIIQSAPVEQIIQQRYIYGSSNKRLSKEAQDSHRYPVTRKELNAIVALRSRPWFHRIWVIQEVALAKKATVYCGDWSLSLASLHQASRTISGLRVFEKLFLNSQSNPRLFASPLTDTVSDVLKNEELPLLKLLTRHHRAGASDIRDIVFALTSIATDAGHIEVDYRKTAVDVFLDATLGIMKQDQTLNVLSQVGSRQKPSNSDLPTWVPSWDIQQVARALVPKFAGNMNTASYDMRATSRSSLNRNLRIEGGKLLLSGYELDSIEGVGQKAHEP